MGYFDYHNNQEDEEDEHCPNCTTVLNEGKTAWWCPTCGYTEDYEVGYTGTQSELGIAPELGMSFDV